MAGPFHRTRVYQTLRHLRELVGDAAYRSADRIAREQFRRFCDEHGGSALRQDVSPRGRPTKTALVVRNISLPYARVEAVVMKALQMAGFTTVAVGRRRYEFLRYDWLVGNQTGYALADFESPGDPDWVDRQVADLQTLHGWLALEYRGVHVGRFVVATVLRVLKIGQLNFADPQIQARLRHTLAFSVRNTVAAERLLDALKPDCVIFMDRGYSGEGEIFDVAIRRGIETLTWNLGYKSNRLVFKRYHAGNQRHHPLTPSAEVWRRICDMPWKPDYGRLVRQELFDCYNTQDWFSVVGTQFDKSMVAREAVRQQLGLTEGRKVAVIFPHILWDGSFFFGEDLFDDYTQWLVETIRAACANDRLEWVIKLHPAHLVKAKQSRDQKQPAELQAIAGSFTTLPSHVKLLYPDSNISTYSLYDVADYVVTVRGTVGIEAAVFGIPVVTAGTGRYDTRGFTLDSTTRHEYLSKLARLETFPRLTPQQIELAERYAYNMFFCRALPLSSVSVGYARDGKATPEVTIKSKTRDEWLAARDMRQIVDWLVDGRAEDMFVAPA